MEFRSDTYNQKDRDVDVIFFMAAPEIALATLCSGPTLPRLATIGVCDCASLPIRGGFMA